MVILNTLFAWLVDAGYLAGNPLSLLRRGQPAFTHLKRRTSTARTTRRSSIGRSSRLRT
jgi:hypothetical protein